MGCRPRPSLCWPGVTDAPPPGVAVLGRLLLPEGEAQAELVLAGVDGVLMVVLAM